ncbi:MAG: tyrosine-type recombinase/integrase [Vallitaleaceae bacterium]|nr:tyrosine-type recombinase/integrase [Vallitaleaceae bacterium]
MSSIQEQMSMELDIRGYTPITKRNYLYHINRFLDLSAVPLEDLDQSHAKIYLHQLFCSGLSFSWMNIAYSAIKFMFIHCLHRDWDLSKLPRPKNPIKLPKFLSTSEVLAVLNATPNLKHRAILSTVYSAGLRVSEVVNLRISDIHSDSMQIFVNLGKGSKDRYTLLSQANLLLLRKYFKKYRPGDYLFTNDHSGLPLSTRTVQRVFKESLAAAGIDRNLSVHSLRHSFATHLIDNNTDIYFVSKLLGHSNLETTAIYLHLSNKSFATIISPLDTFFQEGQDD